MVDKRAVCIEIIGALQEWTDENGLETSAEMEYEGALLIFEKIKDFLKGGQDE